MNNKNLYVIIVVLVIIIVAGGIYFFSNKQDSTAPPVSYQPPVAPAGAPASEEASQAKYNEYLSEIYLGKMAIGKMIGTDGFPAKTGVFTAGTDQFCTMMTLKKPIASGHLAIAIYDTVSRQDDSPKTVFPMELQSGGSGGCGTLTQSAGQYEYKLYLDDVLAAVLPFEVK